MTSNSVNFPTSVDEAAAMVLLGVDYLERHAPERLRQPRPVWQDFDTMPKDGTSLIVCLPRIEHTMLVVSWDQHSNVWRWQNLNNAISLYPGDLWHPLPIAPK